MFLFRGRRSYGSSHGRRAGGQLRGGPGAREGDRQGHRRPAARQRLEPARRDALPRRLAEGRVRPGAGRPVHPGGGGPAGSRGAAGCRDPLSADGRPAIAEVRATTPRRCGCRERTGDAAPLPANEVSAVESTDGAIFKPRADGAWLAEAPNPGQETLTLKLKTAARRPGAAAGFPDRPEPARQRPGPGQQRQLRHFRGRSPAGETPVKLTAAWASARGGWGAWQAIDGISDKGDNLWNAAGTSTSAARCC